LKFPLPHVGHSFFSTLQPTDHGSALTHMYSCKVKILHSIIMSPLFCSVTEYARHMFKAHISQP